MKKSILPLLLLMAFSDSALLADEKILSVRDLNITKIIGVLGVPLHTVHQVECRVVDMSFTKAKGDEGRLALQIISVDGRKREGEHYVDIPRSQLDKPQVGLSYHFWAYETVVADGYPGEAFRKIGEPLFASTELCFISNLVVLKVLDLKQSMVERPRNNQVEHGGAGRPATASESKSEEGEKPQPAPKVAPR